MEEGKSAVSSERAFADFVFGKGARLGIHFTQIVTFPVGIGVFGNGCARRHWTGWGLLSALEVLSLPGAAPKS